MGWFGPCRTPCGCDKMVDDFSGSSIDSAKWELVADDTCDRDATWRLQGGELNLYGSHSGDTGVLRTSTSVDMLQTSGPSAQRVSASVTLASTGHKYRLIGNWVVVAGVDGGTQDKYIYCEVEDKTDGTATFSIGISVLCDEDTVYETEDVELSGQVSMCLYILDSGLAEAGTPNDADVIEGVFTYGSPPIAGAGSDTRGAKILRTLDYGVHNDAPGAETAYAGILGEVGGTEFAETDSTWLLNDFSLEVGFVPDPDNNCATCGDEGNLAINPKCGMCTNDPADTTPETLKLVIPGGAPLAGTHILGLGGILFASQTGTHWAGSLNISCLCAWGAPVNPLEYTCDQAQMGYDESLGFRAIHVCIGPGIGAHYGKTVLRVDLTTDHDIWSGAMSIPHTQYSSVFATDSEEDGGNPFDCEEFFGTEKSMACNPFVSWLSATGRPCNDCIGPATVIAI